MQPFQEFVLKLREHRLEEEVFGLIRLRVPGYHGEREALDDPVAVKLLVGQRDCRLHKGGVHRGVILAHGLAAVPEEAGPVQEPGQAGPLPGGGGLRSRRRFSLRCHRGTHRRGASVYAFLITGSLTVACMVAVTYVVVHIGSLPPSTRVLGADEQRTGGCVRLYVVWSSTHINLLFLQGRFGWP